MLVWIASKFGVFNLKKIVNKLCMKKLMYFLFAMSLIAGSVALPKSFSNQNIDFKSAVVVTDLQTAEKIGKPFVLNGEDAIIKVESDSFLNILENYDAKAIMFNLDESEFESMSNQLRLQTISKIEIEDMAVEYSYTPLYSKSFISDGKKINAEIVRKNNEVVVGFPTIATGY